MTGLRNISAEEKAQFKTRADTEAFGASTGRIGEYADLWGIANAAFSFIHKNKKAVLIRPSDLVPFLMPNIEGDKRRKSFKPACERQMQRMRESLEQAPFDIALDGRPSPRSSRPRARAPPPRLARARRAAPAPGHVIRPPFLAKQPLLAQVAPCSRRRLVSREHLRQALNAAALMRRRLSSPRSVTATA